MDVGTLPTKYKDDLDKAVTVLKEAGCSDVYLFGSLVTGKYHETSDIDLGITGLPPQKYIPTYSQLNNTMKNQFDLIDFDEDKELFHLLNSIGEVVCLG
ncbi:MAG: nucleotidyltransferase domain-containing protein [Spirochaetaceae bacterium]|jgi:predicted nucleotidyltransferase|nr:nucleotidyltransferase domain-containing protein [Spirochaetaceae bacterium]